MTRHLIMTQDVTNEEQLNTTHSKYESQLKRNTN